MNEHYPWKKVGLWLLWAGLLCSPLFFFFWKMAGRIGLVAALVGVAIPVPVWPYLASVLPWADRSRGAIFASACILGLLFAPAASMLGVFALCSAAGAMGVVFFVSMVVMFPMTVAAIALPRAIPSGIPPGCFGGAPLPMGPPWFRTGTALIVIAGGALSLGILSLLLFLSLRY